MLLLTLIICIMMGFILCKGNVTENDYVPPVVGESYSNSGLNFYIYPSEEYVEQLHEEGLSDEEIEKIWNNSQKNDKSKKELFNLE